MSRSAKARSFGANRAACGGMSLAAVSMADILAQASQPIPSLAGKRKDDSDDVIDLLSNHVLKKIIIRAQVGARARSLR
jgi:hypothetical protein